MLCSKCGTRNVEGARFCQNCGAPLPQYAPPSSGYWAEPAPMPGPRKPKTSRRWKKILPAALAVLVLAGVALFWLIRGGNYQVTPLDFMLVSTDDALMLIGKDGDHETIDQDDSSYNMCYSLDCSAALVITGPDKSLYRYDGKTLAHIDDEVYDYQISADGTTAVYQTQIDDDSYALWRYADGEKEKVAEVLGRMPVIVSPDGETVAYQTLLDSDGEDTRSIIWDGKAEEFGKNRSILSISDNADYIYYIKEASSALYVQRGMDENTAVKLCGIDELNSVCFNLDLSEVLLSEIDGNIYLSQHGDMPVQVARDTHLPVLPENVGIAVAYGMHAALKSFSNCLLTSYEKLVWLNHDLESHTVASNLDSAHVYLKRDGKTVYYLKNGTLRKIDASDPNATAEAIAEDVLSYWVSEDEKTVYYYQENEGIYAKEGDKQAVMVSDEVDSMTSVIQLDSTLYYICDGELYHSTGERGMRVAAFDDVVTDIYTNGAPILAVELGDGDAWYYSTDGENFSRLTN